MEIAHVGLVSLRPPLYVLKQPDARVDNVIDGAFGQRQSEAVNI